MSNEKKVLVYLDKVATSEFEYNKAGKLQPVVFDVSFYACVGDIVGISSQNPFELKFLSEIVASLRAYYSGKVIIGQGAMRKKGLLLPHVFFIDTHRMIYDKMTTLEYLTFATTYIDLDPVRKQKLILDMLVKLGMGYLSLTKIFYLSYEEKILVEMLLAHFSKSQIVVMNLVNYDFTDEEIKIMDKLATIISKNGTVVIATPQAKLVGMVCPKLVYLKNGRMRYFGSTANFIKKHDRVRLIITDEKAKIAFPKLVKLFPQFSFKISKNQIFVIKREIELNYNTFMTTIHENEIYLDNVKINRGRLQNAFEMMD